MIIFYKAVPYDAIHFDYLYIFLVANEIFLVYSGEKEMMIRFLNLWLSIMFKIYLYSWDLLPISIIGILSRIPQLFKYIYNIDD